MILIAFMVLLITSCSSSIEEPTISEGINPPSWIIGTWAQTTSKTYLSDYSSVGDVIFTSDNLTIQEFTYENKDLDLKVDTENNSVITTISTSTSNEFIIQNTYSNYYEIFTFSLADDYLDFMYKKIYSRENVTIDCFADSISLIKQVD
jgi:hypothetical protein